MLKIIFIGIALSLILFLLLFFMPKRRKLVFTLYSFLPLIFIMARLIERIIMQYYFPYILQAIPFTLCGIASIILPIIAIFKPKILINLIYFINMPATVFAILLDDTGSNGSLKDLNFWAFTIPHLLYLIIPLFMFIFGYIRPSNNMMIKALICFLVIVNIMHITNSVINTFLPSSLIDEPNPTTNFLFTMYPGDSVGPNPPLDNNGNEVAPYSYKKFSLLKEAWDILPVPYVYLFLLTPILFLVCILMSLPLTILGRIEKKRKITVSHL